jgi:adenine-specific DNA methylase
VDVGVVTGRNEFFVLSMEDVDRARVGSFVIPLVGRSSQLRGALFTKEEWGVLAGRGGRVFLFYVNGIERNELPKEIMSYIGLGEKLGYPKGYKCSVRSPWYAVPSVWAPDCFMFRQIYDFPRLVLNKADVVSTDTIHRVRCNGSAELLVANTYTSLTAASAEIEGRSYGGGVLELEPTEAERLLVPRVLRKGLPLTEIDRLVREGRLTSALRENDKLILVRELGLSTGECEVLRRIWRKMRNRRMNRKKAQRTSQPREEEAPCTG